MNKRYYSRSVSVKVGLFGGQLVRFEEWCFGWAYAGKSTREEVTGYDETTKFSDDYSSYTTSSTKKTKITKTLYFERTAPYTSNLLFRLVELISNIVSFIRRLMIPLLPLAIAALILFGSFLSDDAILIVATVYSIPIGGSILIALLGLILRKVFKIDETLEQNMRDAGYNV